MPMGCNLGNKKMEINTKVSLLDWERGYQGESRSRSLLSHGRIWVGARWKSLRRMLGVCSNEDKEDKRSKEQWVDESVSR